MTQAAIARTVHRSQPTVANTMRLPCGCVQTAALSSQSTSSHRPTARGTARNVQALPCCRSESRVCSQAKARAAAHRTYMLRMRADETNRGIPEDPLDADGFLRPLPCVSQCSTRGQLRRLRANRRANLAPPAGVQATPARRGTRHERILRLPPKTSHAHHYKRTRAVPRSVGAVGSSRVDLQACKLEYSIVSPK